MSETTYRNMRLAPVPTLVVNPLNHYWIIGGSTTEVYSSATNTLVPVDDTNYVDWLTRYTPSPIASEQELQTVLIQRGVQVPLWLFNAPSFIQPAVDTYDKPQLKAYSDDARARKQEGGITVNNMPFATDPVTVMSLNSAYIYTQNNAGATFSWKLPDGTFVTVDTPAHR